MVVPIRKDDDEMMKTLCVISVAAIAGSAMAQGTDGTVRFNGTSPFGGLNGGGEFAMQSVSGANLFGQFQSFCIELNESLAPGVEYNFDINTAAINGGVDGGNPDPLDARTAALYEAFWTGSLASYDFDNNGDGGLGNTLNRQKSGAALQAAIWEIEQERSIEDTSSDQDVRDLANFYVDTLSGQLAASGLGTRVRVLNMYRADNGAASQDILVLIPLPQAGALAAMGLAGLAVRRRTRR